eukprot:SAG25_NODE_14248_length_257_cov_0.658228_1_plen_59_part_01
MAEDDELRIGAAQAGQPSSSIQPAQAVDLAAAAAGASCSGRPLLRPPPPPCCLPLISQH